MNTRERTVVAETPDLSLHSLRARLFDGIEDWAQPQAPGLLMSVNQVLTRADLVLKAGDEVAFFSPFSGG